jgi:hypothetical protein
MAIAGLIVSVIRPHIDRRFGILVSLVGAACQRPGFDGVHDPAHRVGPGHGICVYADAGLFAPVPTANPKRLTATHESADTRSR